MLLMPICYRSMEGVLPPEKTRAAHATFNPVMSMTCVRKWAHCVCNGFAAAPLMAVWPLAEQRQRKNWHCSCATRKITGMSEDLTVDVAQPAVSLTN